MGKLKWRFRQKQAAKHAQPPRVTGADLAHLAAQLEMAAVAMAAWARDFDKLQHPSPEAERRCLEALGAVQPAMHAMNVWINSIDPRSVT